MSCKAGTAREAMAPDDRATLDDWLSTGANRDTPVSADTMATAMTAGGWPVSPTTLKDHRGSRCVCARSG